MAVVPQNKVHTSQSLKNSSIPIVASALATLFRGTWLPPAVPLPGFCSDAEVIDFNTEVGSVPFMSFGPFKGDFGPASAPDQFISCQYLLTEFGLYNVIFGYSSSAGVSVFSGSGTPDAPRYPQIGQLLMTLGAGGWNESTGAFNNLYAGEIVITATDNWSATSQPGHIGFVATPVGSTNPVNVMQMFGDRINAYVPLIVEASVAANAGLRVPHGVAPTTPVNGDVWTTTAGMFVRINGVTKSVNLT